MGGSWGTGTGRCACESSPGSGSCCCSPLGPATGLTIMGSVGSGIVLIVTWGGTTLGSCTSLLNLKGIPPSIELHEFCPLHAVGDAIVDISICWGGSGSVVAAAWEGTLEAQIWSMSICAGPNNGDIWLACDGCSWRWSLMQLWAHSGVFMWWSDISWKYEPQDWRVSGIVPQEK